MINKSYTIRFFNKLILLIFVCFQSGCASFDLFKSFKNKNEYRCELFFNGICFDFKDYNSFSVERNIDFYLLNVYFDNGDEAFIYSGMHPDIPDKNEFSLKQCYTNKDECLEVIKNDSHIFEVVYSENQNPFAMHLLYKLKNSSNSSTKNNFLESIRQCKQVGSDIICQDKKIISGEP